MTENKRFKVQQGIFEHNSVCDSEREYFFNDIEDKETNEQFCEALNMLNDKNKELQLEKQELEFRLLKQKSKSSANEQLMSYEEFLDYCVDRTESKGIGINPRPFVELLKRNKDTQLKIMYFEEQYNLYKKGSYFQTFIPDCFFYPNFFSKPVILYFNKTYIYIGKVLYINCAEKYKPRVDIGLDVRMCDSELFKAFRNGEFTLYTLEEAGEKIRAIMSL